MPKQQVLQPQYFERFRCIGPDCEDTCCDGWGIIVDQNTWEKYQDPGAGQVLGKPLASLVEINPASSSSSDYAKIRLTGTRCPALSEGLCSIHQNLGEPSISDMCSSFPRVMNLTGGVLERSLHLSCPEAARFVLTDPDAMVLYEHTEEELANRPGAISPVGDTAEDKIQQVRSVMIGLIRDRSRPLWKRIASLGFAVDNLTLGDMNPLRRDSFEEALGNQAPAPAEQLAAVMELIVARMGAEYISPRFLECYREFMDGLGWTSQSTMEELGERYQRALHTHFLPFVRRHEHMFENYLLNYVFRTLFPYGRKQPDTKIAIDTDGSSMRSAYLVLAAHYAIIRTVLIGMAALHGENLSVQHAIKVVQSCTKAFQHSGAFSAVAVEFLLPFAEDPTHGVALLVMD